ncbi:QRFP-like peptide receptor [Ptychodera flava]|uniref:QRFP-like peptide receptor n=1 Tax=Ptychodera flava TaxID=63121 RepID=UPI003969C5C5
MTTSLVNVSDSGNYSIAGTPLACVLQNEKMITFVYYVIACTIALLGNLAFLVVVIKVKSMRTMPNFFFINLSMADVLFMAYHLMFLIADNFGTLAALKTFHIKGGHSITDVSFCVSMLTVALISLNRYIAICHPFRAETMRLQSPSRIAVSIAFCWFIGICIAAFDIFISSSLKQQAKLLVVLLVLLSLFIVASFSVVMVSYVLIAKRMFSTKRSNYTPAGYIAPSCISEESQVLLLSVAITAVFFLSCSPMATVYIVVTFNQLLGQVIIAQDKLNCLTFIAKMTISLHFTLNPILYNIGSRNHRTAFCEVWKIGVNRQEENSQQEYV